jgi:hypothetical protein
MTAKMKRCTIYFLILISALSCKEHDNENIQGRFSLKFSDDKDFKIIESNDSTFLSIDTIKGSKSYSLKLRNIGEEYIEDISIVTDNPNFIILPTTLYGLPNDQNGDKDISLKIKHETGYDVWQPLNFLQMGYNSCNINFSGKTIKAGILTDINYVLNIKVYAEIMAVNFTQCGITVDSTNTFLTGYSVEKLLGKYLSLYSYSYKKDSSVLMKNTGNVPIKMTLFGFTSHQTFQNAIIYPNETIILKLPSQYAILDEPILKLDSKGVIFNNKWRLTLGNDGCGYALFSINNH